MYGPPLTRLEVAALLHAEVNRLVASGMDGFAAITTVGKRHGVDSVRVAELIGAASGIAGEV